MIYVDDVLLYVLLELQINIDPKARKVQFQLSYRWLASADAISSLDEIPLTQSNAGTTVVLLKFKFLGFRLIHSNIYTYIYIYIC